MVCRVITRNGNHYISYAGLPYIWCGPEEPTICTTGNIVTDYVISFLDEAHPHYVIGTGNVGSLWGPDLYYYYNEISTLDPPFPSCAHILFDVDTARVAKSGLSIDPFFVYPTGVNSSNLTGCYMPVPEMNVVRIERPSGVSSGTISQSEFADRALSGITDIWGTGFYNRMAAVSGTHKLWIIREDSDSLPFNVIESGINIIKNTLIASGIEVQEYNGLCLENERYLGWVIDCVKYNGDSVSCTGNYQVVDINDIQNSGGTHTTGKLTLASINGYSNPYNYPRPLDGPNTEVYVGTFWDSTTDQENIDFESVRDDLEYVIYDEENRQIYYTYMNGISYTRGIPTAYIIAICYEHDGEDVYSTQYGWYAEIPIDKYGLPQGTIEQPEDPYVISSDSSCIPDFPTINFTSYPPSNYREIPGETGCINLNP